MEKMKNSKPKAIEKMRAYAFTPTPNPDAVKGIGSFASIIGKTLRANNSKSDWEKSNRRIYGDNSDA